MSAICTHTQFHGRAYLSSSSWVSPLTKGLRSLCDPSVLCINIRPFTGRRYLSFGSGITRRRLQRYWSAPRSIILFRLEPSSALARPDIISFYNDEDVEDNDGYGVAVVVILLGWWYRVPMKGISDAATIYSLLFIAATSSVKTSPSFENIFICIYLSIPGVDRTRTGIK